MLGGLHIRVSACVRTKAGDVSIQSDVFQVPFGCFHLRGVALSHVVHREHGLLTELGIVVKADLGIKADHWGKVKEEEEDEKDRVGGIETASGEEDESKQRERDEKEASHIKGQPIMNSPT